jgi:16S rRNA (cytosine967-C5)-methyltransferase
MAVSTSRRAAFGALMAVETRAAFADELLHGGRLDKLDERDRALATELTLGVLRWRGALDSLVEQRTGKPAAALDPEVRTALRLGAYQLRYLDRAPAHAAVSESVELVKRGPRRSAAGLVNAVLRRLPERATHADETALAYPAWLGDRWRARLGEAGARAAMAAGLERPATWLRLDVRRDLDETVRMLADEGVETEPVEFPWARRLVAGRPERTRAWAEGRVRIQDIGSQAVVPLLGLKPGMTFLDVCAAPGGKARQAIEMLGGARGVVAGDRSPARLETLRRLGAETVDAVAFDAERPLPLARRFDRVLVDAPCSGTGTLGRNPDIKWRLQLADLADLAARQRRILANALDAAASGGSVVYSTCSLEPEENEHIVAAVLAERPGWRVEATLERNPGREPGDGFRAFRLTA